MKIIKAGIIIILILTLGVNALEIYDKECKNDGSLRVVVKGDSKAKVYTSEIEVKVGQIAMPGSWDTNYVTRSTTAAREYSTYQSEANILTAKRSYPINVEYKETQEDGSKTIGTAPFEIECPGLVFSCKNLNITILSCENQEDGLFRSSIHISGLEQSEIAKMDVMQVVDFIIEAENKYKDMTGKETARGTLPYKAQVIRIEKDEYVVRYEFSSKNNNTVKTLWAGYNNNLKYTCKQVQYPEVKFYDKVECVKQETAQQTEPEEEKVDTQTETEKEQPKETQKPTKKAEQIIQEQPKNYKPLAIVSIILIVVLSVGGIILSYLYKRGYL